MFGSFYNKARGQGILVQIAFVIFFTQMCEKYNKASCRLVNKKTMFFYRLVNKNNAIK
jgi:hypothetical protein